MSGWIPIAVAVGLMLLLSFLRKPGKGGIIGHKVRASDHWAWRDAVAEKRRELDELMKHEPPKP